MKWNNSLVYTILLQILYIGAMLLFPAILSKTLFLVPIIITIGIAYAGGWRKGVIAALLGAASAGFMLLLGVVPANDVLIRYISYTIITSGVLYAQKLKDRVEEYAQDIALVDDRLKYISSSVDDVIFTLNPDMSIRYVTDSVKNMFGYNKEELLGQHMFKLYSEEFAESYTEYYEDYKVTGDKHVDWSGTEAVGKRKDGTYFDIEIKVWESIVEDNRYFTLIISDITEKKVSERKVKELANIVESSEDAIISKNLDSVVQTWNRGAEKLFGYTPEEAIGKNILDLIFPDHLKREEAKIMSTILKGGVIEHYETIRKKKDGTFVNISLTNSPLKDEDGNIIGVSKIARDITVRKKLEGDLRNSEERYKAFVRNSSEGIWRFELKKPCSTELSVEEQIEWIYKYGYFAECNDAMAQMYGYNNHTEIVGRPLEFLLPKMTTNRMYLSVFIRKGYNVENIESTEKSLDGKEIYFLNSLVGIVEDGKLYRGWGVQRDISASKKYAIEREKLLHQVTASKLTAEIANQEKDRFLANLSHELRTPLVSVLGYSALLKDETKLDKIQSGLEVIHKNAELQLSLIEDLLDISRIISGKINLKKEEFNIKEIVKFGVESMRPKYEAKSLDVTYTQLDIKLYADRRRFAQIFNNLLSNAIKFTEKGSIDVSYHVKDDKFYLKVKDTGMGIAKKDFPKLFKQFSQLSADSTRSKSGLGLGLSIVKSLTELHGGTVNVDSTLDVGSTFTVMIPLIEKESEDIITTSLEGLRILVVEDEEDIGQLLKTTLERKGADVVLKTRAKAALEACANNGFNLYLFDLAMPEEDGISLIKKIRAKGDKTPAVAISAYINYEDVALDNGFNLFLPKPLDINNIHQIKILLK